MAIKLPLNVPAPLFVTWGKDEKGMQSALATVSKAYKSIDRANASATTFRNIDSPHISVRDGFSRTDYDYFRPGERIPSDIKGIQLACCLAYRQFGIVRNMIDMMTDFVTKGINIVHKSPKIQEFGRQWGKKCKMKSVSNKIVKRLLREAAAPVQRKIQKVADDDLRNLNDMAVAALAPKSPLGKGEIPLGYKILNPASIEVMGGELTQFLNEDLVQYAIKISAPLVKKLQNPKTAYEKQIVKALKPDIFKQAINGEDIIPIAPNRMVMLHYKKDDDELWGTPLLYSILDDLQMLQKLKQADRSALDGAISHIRLWKMGNLEYKIAPTVEGIQTLADILLRSTGGGCVDLVWGPDLELIETGTDIYKFLGPEKYKSVMACIYQGLGVPPSLTGTMSDAGATNNFVSLRVLMERLEYCREILIDFWFNELEILRDVFSIKQPFDITFAVPNLSDDSAEKKLLVDLIDRDVLSGEFVQERFGADPEIETARMDQEKRKRDSEELPQKAGPYHLDSQQKPFLQRTLLQNGEVTPSQIGMDLPKPKNGEQKPVERDSDLQTKLQATKVAAKQNAKPNGRKIGSKDSVKRKPARQAPKQNSKASLANAIVWVRSAHSQIDDQMKDMVLKVKGKSNMRQLTDEESNAYENLKYSVLCNHEVGSAISSESIKNVLKNPQTPDLLTQICNTTIKEFIDKNKTKPSLDQVRQIRELAYAMFESA